MSTMTSWTLRHQGSPQAVADLTTAQVVEGLQEGAWEPTDEVRGPQDPDWVPLESHPQFAEVAADLEPPPPRHYDDQTHLDMNALIDVCLVLLIFFILTTTYSALQQVLRTPDISAEGEKGPLQYTKEKVEELMIQVTVRMEGDRPVIRVEKQVVEEEDLVLALRQFAGKTGKTRLLLDYDYDVPHGTVVLVQDAAKGAQNIGRIHILVPEKEL